MWPNILEGVVILHETMHELHREKVSGLLLKIDFEKAYDKVKWPFLLQTLRIKGFLSKWCSWVETYINEGSVAIKINEETSRYFQTKNV